MSEFYYRKIIVVLLKYRVGVVDGERGRRDSSATRCRGFPNLRRGSRGAAAPQRRQPPYKANATPAAGTCRAKKSENSHRTRYTISSFQIIIIVIFFHAGYLSNLCQIGSILIYLLH